MSDKEKVVSAQRRILSLAKSVQTHLDYPKILKGLYKCIVLEHKNMESTKFELSSADKSDVCRLAKNLESITKSLFSTKKAAEYSMSEDQLTTFIANLEKELILADPKQSVAQVAGGLSVAAGQAASAVIGKAKAAVSEGIKNIKKKIDEE